MVDTTEDIQYFTSGNLIINSHGGIGCFSQGHINSTEPLNNEVYKYWYISYRENKLKYMGKILTTCYEQSYTHTYELLQFSLTAKELKEFHDFALLHSIPLEVEGLLTEGTIKYNLEK